ncbi:hypothetical protein [Intrasporangium sp. YIM S08009]|uniref:hypothetical protein n=1 Tax=Intrasporangium zincisolvens TaxID=3080018 RepID=UPI002B054E88|nr:hypothetical protein [Intrasporangium sp. YIM S08009]
MDTPELTALVPGLMARHPNCAWTIVPARVPGDVLEIQLHDKAWPDRVAEIKVGSGGETYLLHFAGQLLGPEFGYDDVEKVEALEEVIETAVALTTGPTRITRDVADGVVLTTRLEIDPDGPNRESLGVNLDAPVAFIKARLRGREITREVTDLPGAGEI